MAGKIDGAFPGPAASDAPRPRPPPLLFSAEFSRRASSRSLEDAVLKIILGKCGSLSPNSGGQEIELVFKSISSPPHSFLGLLASCPVRVEKG